MAPSRTGTAYKYTRTEGSKICYTYILQIQKGSSSPCTNGQSSSISLFCKNGRDKKSTLDLGGKKKMGILLRQSDHTYCRIPARDFKYQGRQGLQGNEKFVKRMDIKQAVISETDTGFRISGCGSVSIQVVPPDPKVHKLATRSTCMDGECISNKLDTPKSICLPTINVSQSNERQSYVDHNNTSVAFPAIVHTVIENVYTRSNFYSPISKYFDRPKPKPTPNASESNISFSSMEVPRQQYSAEGSSD